MIKNKRGSHVGRVLSFMIFIVFFVYFYSLLGPEIIMKRDKESLIDYLEIEIKKNITGTMNSITIMLETSPHRRCILLSNLLEEIETENSRIVIENEDEENVSAFRRDSTDNVYLSREDNSNDFFKIYSSEEFSEMESVNPPPYNFGEGCAPSTPILNEGEDYTVHHSLATKGILLPLFEDLMYNYETDYGDLRGYFNFPTGSDFGFGIQLENGTLVQTENPDVDIDVYVQKTPIDYFTEEGKREQGFLIVKVW